MHGTLLFGIGTGRSDVSTTILVLLAGDVTSFIRTSSTLPSLSPTYTVLVIDHQISSVISYNYILQSTRSTTPTKMVELRKRKSPADTAPLTSAKKASSVKSSASSKKSDSSTSGLAATDNKVIVGNTITLDKFGGEVETNDGEKVTLKKLVDKSKSGVVLFTYPKASTPGCR